MNLGIWIKNYINHPLQLGAVLPSSAALASLMTKHLSNSIDGYVLELGPGTGSFTRAILRRGIPERNLVLVEQSPDFTKLLRQSFPAAKVFCGDAQNVTDILNSAGIQQVDEIVSGIPLNAMTPIMRRTICDAAMAMLKHKGSFVQVSYLPRCSIPKDSISLLSAQKLFCGMTVRNIPPAFVWRAKLS